MFFILMIAVICISLILLFIYKKRNKRKGGNMAYGAQVYDESGKGIFDSKNIPFKFIDEKIVFEGENKTFTYSLPGYKLVAWLAPMQPILDQRVFIKINNNAVVVKSNVKNINKEVKYKIFIGAY